MIDSILIPSGVHLGIGMAVMLTTLASLVVAAVFGARKLTLPRWALGLFILTQVVVAAQLLVGIKLLDQGLGPLQLYVHYLGGTGVLFFYLLFYWLPTPTRTGRWTPTVITGLAFAFAMMTFTIGEMYVAGGA
ncbi:MAG TPA: hypothetical protein VFD39_12950 [Trueperaceae bacterium]|nr:hypothetical protein [Trueperaceae bacterium]